jgi:hypothetical protein
MACPEARGDSLGETSDTREHRYERVSCDSRESWGVDRNILGVRHRVQARRAQGLLWVGASWATCRWGN